MPRRPSSPQIETGNLPAPARCVVWAEAVGLVALRDAKPQLR